MLLYPSISDIYVMMHMRDILSIVLRGCEQAKHLQAHLPDMAGEPQLLLDSCKAIAANFNFAVDRLGSDRLAVFGDQASETGCHMARAADQEDSLGSALVVRAMDLLNTKAAEEESPLFVRAYPEGDVDGGPSSVPELGREIPTTSALVEAIELGSSSGTGGRGLLVSSGLVACTAACSGGGSQDVTVAMRESRDTRTRPAGRPSAPRTSRKRKSSSEIWTIRVPALRPGNIDIPPDDGYTWRKYGQKDILSFKYPRSYYRCTHKSFYGCNAKKQVQRLDDDPYMYEVTYCGRHTCQTSPTPYLSIHNVDETQENELKAAGAASGALALLEPSRSPSLSMSMGSRWFSAGGVSGLLQKDDSLHADDGDKGANNITVSPPLRAAGNSEFAVADLANAMFNSRSSGHSMDSIFSNKQK